MRSSLWPGLIQALQHNLNRQQLRVRLFEIGMVFNRMQSDIEQHMVLAGLAYGPALPEQWSTAARRVDFFDVKADVAALVPGETIRYEVASHPDLHPGQAACLWRGEQQLGWLGSLHPRLVKLLDLPATPVVFQLELQVLRMRDLPRFQVYSKFPSVRRDLAFIVAEQVDAVMIEQVIRKADHGLLQKLDFFDVYQGKGVEPGSKSVAISLIFQAQSRTLEVQEVDAAVAEIIAAMQNNLHAKLRE
jgi:phenylalanyl-tRNA synthetase beta chain